MRWVVYRRNGWSAQQLKDYVIDEGMRRLHWHALEVQPPSEGYGFLSHSASGFVQTAATDVADKYTPMYLGRRQDAAAATAELEANTDIGVCLRQSQAN